MHWSIRVARLSYVSAAIVLHKCSNNTLKAFNTIFRSVLIDLYIFLENNVCNYKLINLFYKPLNYVSVTPSWSVSYDQYTEQSCLLRCQLLQNVWMRAVSSSIHCYFALIIRKYHKNSPILPQSQWLNILGPKQNSCHFTDVIFFKCIFVNRSIWLLDPFDGLVLQHSRYLKNSILMHISLSKR